LQTDEIIGRHQMSNELYTTLVKSIIEFSNIRILIKTVGNSEYLNVFQIHLKSHSWSRSPSTITRITPAIASSNF